MLNAGKYDRKITIYKIVEATDAQGFRTPQRVEVLQPYAAVKTTKGFTLIANNSDFEKALTRFTIRYSETVVNAYYDAVDSNRDLLIDFKNKTYKVVYLNNIDEANVELEIQTKEILK